MFPSISNKSELNKMLKSKNVPFNKFESSKKGTFRIQLDIEDRSKITEAIEGAVQNPQVVANLEYELNDNQPIECTIKHLNLLKLQLSDVNNLKKCNVHHVDARSSVSIADVLLYCQIWATYGKENIQLVVDAAREALLKKIFGEEQVKAVKTIDNLKCKNLNLFKCTQVIFECGDIESAIDALLINLSDRTLAPWRITSIYVQESVKEKFLKSLTPERINKAAGVADTNTVEPKNKFQQAALKYNAKLLSSADGRLNILIGITGKHLEDAVPSYSDNTPATVLNFFRTPKELYQLSNNEKGNEDVSLVSIWSENTSLLYEVVNSLNGDIFWNNSIGIFADGFPRVCEALLELNAHNDRWCTVFFLINIKFPNC